MIEPFIRNHQYNVIKKQAGILQHASKTVTDPNVLEVVKYRSEAKVIEAFSELTDIQIQLLSRISSLNTTEDIQQYVSSLEPYLIEFPEVTEKQIKKLFPKNKKLKIPNLSTINYRSITYIGWLDIAKNKMFIVYNMNGDVVGVEGKYTLTHKKNTCSLCKGYGKVALFSAISKSKPANASPDYYKAFGNYMCIDSDECNKNITDVTYLEKFIQDVIV